MSLTINSPLVENKLRREAEMLGVSTADYAADILAAHLEPQAHDLAAPFFATATLDEWNAEFDAWIDGHPSRRALPDSALSRESIYEGPG